MAQQLPAMPPVPAPGQATNEMYLEAEMIRKIREVQGMYVCVQRGVE
jgi:hypothetical protein